MPNYCPSCAAALEPDAKFCPACSAPVAPPVANTVYGGPQGGGAYSSQGAGAYAPQPARPMGQYQPSINLDPIVIAGALSLFWTMWFFILSFGSSSFSFLSAAGRFTSEGDVAVAMIASAFYVLAFAVFAMITYGVFNRKKWTENLATYGGGAVAVIWMILTIIMLIMADSKMTVVIILTIFGVLIGLGLVGLLIWSLRRNRHQFTNP